MSKYRLPSLIKSIYRRKAIIPILFLCFVTAVIHITPLHHVMFLKSVTTPKEAASMYHSGDIYVRATLTDLYYAGVNQMNGRDILACYYYCINENNCYYVLISAKELGVDYDNPEPPARLDSYQCVARLEQNSSELSELTKHVSSSLGWTSQALNLMTGKVLINQYTMSLGRDYILLFLVLSSGIVAVVHLAVIIIALINPSHSRTVMSLSRYGNVSELYTAACEEYEESHPYAPGITLTDNFYIASDSYNIYIVPLCSIVWAYKFSTLHSLPFRARLSYSLLVVTENKKHFTVRGKTREAADQVLNALQTRFPGILIGYSEKKNI